MKKILLLLCLSLFFGSSASAYVQMNEQTIERAQEYGIMNYQRDLPSFAKPWAVFEEKSKSLDEFGEKAYIYTPYYLVAVNARERLLASQTINVSDGKIIIDAFGDALPVCVVLYVKDATDIQGNVVALMRQKGELLEAYAMEIQDVAVVQTMVVKEEVIPVKIELDPVTTSDPTTDDQVNQATETDAETKDVKDKDTKEKDKDKDKKKKDKKKEKEKEKNKDKDKKDKDKKDEKDGKQEPQPPVEEKPTEPVYIEKVVPSLHRVQLFVYFDKRHLQLYGQTTLIVDLKNDQERRFNFSFDTIQ